MKKVTLCLLLILLGTLSACHSDNDPAVDNMDPVMNDPDPEMPDPPDNSSMQFNSFVKNLVALTADDLEPVEIDSVMFMFDEDEEAFDELL